MLKQVLEKITPSRQELEKEMRKAEEIRQKILHMKGKHLEVVLAGSLARNTHLKGDRDIDLFVMFHKNLGRKEFQEEGLRIGKRVFAGHKWEKAFTEHPYIRGEIDGYEVEIVPTYKVEEAEKLQSAVDRSPFHSKYLQGKLGEEQKDSVRLLKKFLKNIKAYGADARASSIPGYAVELIILKYGDFEVSLKEISSWEKGEVIDIENYWEREKARKKFCAPLIMVDPTDKNRNVSAALSEHQMNRIIAATRAFLKKPSRAFFFGKKEKTMSYKKAKQAMKKTELLALGFSYPKAVADIVWGQTRRLARKIANALMEQEFNVLRAQEWTDEKNHCVIVFELEAIQLEKAMKRFGPLVTNKSASENFLKAHKRVFSGPRIEQGRWVLEIERKYPNAKKYLEEYASKLASEEKGALRKALKKRKIMMEKELLEMFKKNAEFREFFSCFLKGKEEFLEY